MTQTDTRTEWAGQLTWPDGHVEYRTHDRLTQAPHTRRTAELCVEHNNADRAEGRTDATAVLVDRTVTTTAWAPVVRAGLTEVAT